ncbi:MAG: MFS transporter [Alphaproteobacteria bacterium]|nr:MFS transporter [Alphaproteobacteria bacterium]
MPLLVALGFAAFASSVQMRALDPMLPVVAGDLGVDLSRAALLVSAYSFPYAAMQIVLGPAADALGKVRLICISLVGVAVGSAFGAMAPGYSSLVGARIVSGAFAGGIIPIAWALIGDRVAYVERQVAISRVMVVAIVGQMIGAAGAGLSAETIGWRWAFAAAAAIAVGSLAVVWYALRGTEQAAHRPTLRAAFASYRTVLASPMALLVFAAVAGEGILFFGLFPFVAPMLAEHGGGGAAQAGVAIAGFGVGGVAYGVTARRIIHGLGPWRMLASGGAIAGGMYLIMAWPLAWTMVALLFVAAGFGFYMVHNTLQLQGSELAPTTRGSAFALFASFFFMGQGVGPVLGAAVARHFGYTALFAGAGVLVVVLAAAVAAAMRRVSNRLRPDAATL